MRRLDQRTLWTAAAALLSASFSLFAQQPAPPTGGDPTRGVARISIVQGVVNVKRGDSGEVVAAAQNAPLMTQDHLETADGSRSEIEFDAGNLVRLAPNTELGLADVERGRYQMQLASGTIIYRIIRDYRADVEIDTPSISVRPRGVGSYRVSVYGDGTTAVTVRTGEAAIYSPRGSQSLRAGQTMLVRGPSSDPEFQMQSEIAPDQFDDWSNNRDQQMLASRSPQYVSPDIYGTEDLDQYGNWVPSSYGNVWAPQVAPGWAPYQDGRWVWGDYYGWTWLDYDPWGWAPFHYGRWFWNGGHGWCWWPGAIRQAYAWAPALVGFFGFGRGLGLSIGFGFANLGWVALAPFELFHPWYGPGWFGRPGWGGFYNHAFVNNANIYNAFRNARINNAVAYTGINNFGRASQAFYRANGTQIRSASLVQGQVPVAPGRSSLAFSNRAPIGVSQRFGSSQNQRFFSHQQPSQSQRVPFARQQQQMAQFQERTLGVRPNLGNEETRTRSTGQGFRPFSGPSGSAYGATPRASSPGSSAGRQMPSDNGWHRFGDPGASAYVRPNERPAQGGGGWGSFGSPGGMGAPRNQGTSRYQNSFGGGHYSQPQSQRFAEPMRINPPIVRRPSYSAPRSMESHPSTPHYSAPHYSAPHSSAPSGGGHSGGGHSGGGGGHSGGGGHHR